MRKVLLGYEIGTGKAIEIPILHTAVTGQTQQSGKTTTLEALIKRSGLRAVTFITKRAEGAFDCEQRIPAFFRERADWQFVESLLEATMKERMKFERSWIMRVCKGAQTLKAVHKNVKAELRDASGLNESVYLTLDEYLSMVIPQLERLPYSTKLELKPGINTIDVAEYSSEVQALVIRSVIESVYKRERDTIVLIPEAWEFVPQKRNSPVKLAAIELIRKGAAAGNYIWLDSQDIAGVDKEVLKQVSAWILGVQREANEVKRTLAHLPPTAERPTVEDIMTLGRGEFYVSHGRELNCVYVQPSWLDKHPEKARQYAIEQLPASFVAKPKARKTKALQEKDGPEHKTEDVMKRSGSLAADGFPRKARNVFERCEFRTDNGQCTLVKHDKGAHVFGVCAYEHDNEEMAWAHEEINAIARELEDLFPGELIDSNGLVRGTVAEVTIRLLRALKDHRSAPRPKVSFAEAPAVDLDAIAAEVFRRLQTNPEFSSLHVSAEKPELSVTVQRKVIDLDASTLRGRLAQMIAQGFFESARNGNTAYNELQRVGFRTAKPNVYRELDNLASMGFLTKEPSGGYQAVADMKINIREVEVA
jgi:hypothetical protein